MEKIIEQTISKAIKMLEACDCQFAIIDKDGNEYGELEVVVQKKRSANLFPYGELKNYIKQHIDNLQPGDVVSIPALHYGLGPIQSSASSTACVMFGNGSCTTTRNREKNTVEILRVF